MGRILTCGSEGKSLWVENRLKMRKQMGKQVINEGNGNCQLGWPTGYTKEGGMTPRMRSM